MRRLLHSTGGVEAGGDDVLSSPTLNEIHVYGEIEIALSSVGNVFAETQGVRERLYASSPCDLSPCERLQLTRERGWKSPFWIVCSRDSCPPFCRYPAGARALAASLPRQPAREKQRGRKRTLIRSNVTSLHHRRSPTRLPERDLRYDGALLQHGSASHANGVSSFRVVIDRRSTAGPANHRGAISGVTGAIID